MDKTKLLIVGALGVGVFLLMSRKASAATVQPAPARGAQQTTPGQQAIQAAQWYGIGQTIGGLGNLAGMIRTKLGVTGSTGGVVASPPDDAVPSNSAPGTDPQALEAASWYGITGVPSNSLTGWVW